MSNESKLLGRELSRLRKDKGISVEKMSRNIKVRQSLIEALEKGDLENLPHPIFVKGFIRAYAERLDVDPKKVLDLYETVIGNRKNDKEEKKETPEDSQSSHIVRWVTGSLMIAGVLIILVWWIGWGRIPSSGQTETSRQKANQMVKPVNAGREATIESKSHKDRLSEPEATRNARSIETHEKSTEILDGKTVTVNKTDKKTGEEKENKILEPQSPPPRGLYIRCNEECWIEVRSGDTLRAARLMKTGDVLALNGVHFLVNIGNTAGVELYYNGNRIDLPNIEGKVLKDLSFPPASGEKEQSDNG